jgi:hypothetical protein
VNNCLSLKSIDDLDEYDKPCKRLQILIDGASFLDLVREVELPYATLEGRPEGAGKYIWMRPYRWAVDALSAAALAEGYGKRRIFLQCDCEILGCWPLQGNISLQDGMVVWDGFENDHRGPDSPAGHWRHDLLGPFLFDPEPYQAEIDGIDVIPDD